MWNPNIETFLACDADYSEATTVLFGAPYDSTTSFRPGTRFGPHAIRSESFGLESYSPYQDRDLTDYAILDIGDMELRFCWAANIWSHWARSAPFKSNIRTFTSFILMRIPIYGKII